MTLYPVLDSDGADPLQFSDANRLTGFETARDSVLKEMNERAKQLLESQPGVFGTIGPATNNMFDMPASPEKENRASPRHASKRFSMSHRQQFARMDSISSHPKAGLRRSKRLVPGQRSLNPPTLAPGLASALAPVSQLGEPIDLSPSKRQGDLLESPSKRVRRQPEAQPQPQPQPQSQPQSVSRFIPQPTPRSRVFSAPQMTPSRPLPPTPASSRPGPSNSGSSNAKSLRPRASMDTLRSPMLNGSTPSYLRPTQSSLRKSQSVQALRPITEQHANSRIPTKFGSVSRPNGTISTTRPAFGISASRSSRNVSAFNRD